MTATEQDPPEPDNTEVTLEFRLSFSKKTDIVLPGSNSLHELRAICLPRTHHLITLEPSKLCDDRSLTDDNKEAIRRYYENRALLSVAIGFVDAEFAVLLHGLIPPPEEFRPKRPHPHPHPGC